MPIDILALGDVMPGENMPHFNRGIRTKFGDNYENLISREVKSKLFKEIDLLLFNFEYSLVDDNFKFKDIHQSVYCAKASSLDIFPGHVKMVANVANNHFSQHGPARTDFTINKLAEKKIEVVGLHNKPTIINHSNHSILIWGVSLIEDKKYCNKYFKSSYNNLLAEIHLPEKSANDVWIISIHWGNEYITHPSKKQMELGHILVDAGFDFVIGHHPHVIQPVEKYSNGYIFYSLGNFIFDQNFSAITRKGLAVKINIDTKNDDIHVFKTFQSKYKVVKTKKTSAPISIIKPLKLYNLQLRVNRLLYRFLMKLEQFANLRNLDRQFIRFVLKKTL